MEVSWAIIPGAGGTQWLPRLIGPSLAKELILTARRIDANKAHDGLVNKVTDKDNLLTEVLKLADETMKNGPLAVIQAKHVINNGANTDINTGLAIESKAYEMIIPTEDRIKVIHGFKEKRPTDFKGK